MRNNEVVVSKRLVSYAAVVGLALVAACALLPATAAAESKNVEISFSLVPNPKFINCLR